MRFNGPRFYHFRTIVAKRDSAPGEVDCGHPVKKGDEIGYSRKYGIRCNGCWSKWVAENEEADRLERASAPEGGW